jgi:type III pantothenate kinase
MLYTVDIGNTSAGIAGFREDRVVHRNKLTTPKKISPDFVSALFGSPDRGAVDGVIVSSVVPSLDENLGRMVESLFGVTPLFVDHLTKSGVSIRIDHPEELGADRIADAVGALCHAPPPVVVIDSGTAVTFDLINADREYIGGAILPGIDLALDSLASQAAKLHRVPFKKPPSVVGTDTETSIQAGVYYLYLGGLIHMIDAYKKMLGPATTVFATGGLAVIYKGKIPAIDRFEPDLIYHGLKRIHEIQDRG